MNTVGSVWLNLSRLAVNTVCAQANCPNILDCFKDSRLAFMILGNRCSRNCRFCAVQKSGNNFLPLDSDEPFRVAQAVKQLGLRYAVITSVTRDDLEEAAALVFAKTIGLIRAIDKDIKVEALIPDFSGKKKRLKAVVDSGPCVIGHNLETVKRLHKGLKPKAKYGVSLGVLRRIKQLNPGMITKSSLMLGLGEQPAEVAGALTDLRSAGCDIVTLGQYLAPSAVHYPVREFISREQFEEYGNIAVGLGFKAVLCGRLVRSSYQAEEVYRRIRNYPIGERCMIS